MIHNSSPREYELLFITILINAVSMAVYFNFCVFEVRQNKDYYNSYSVHQFIYSISLAHFSISSMHISLTKSNLAH